MAVTDGVRVGGVVELIEVVPLMFLAVTAMLIALTRLEQGLAAAGRRRELARPRGEPVGRLL